MPRDITQQMLRQAGFHVSDRLADRLESLIGVPAGVREFESGLVHRVARVHGGGGSVVLKAREAECRRLDVKLVPEDIDAEYRALLLVGRIASDIVPMVHGFDRVASTLLLEDVETVGQSLALDYLARCDAMAAGRFWARLGSAVARIHVGLAAHPLDALRSDELADGGFFAHNLDERIGVLEWREIAPLLDQVRALPRQLVLGDLSPKNLIAGPERLTLLDLEDCHAGVAVFDLAFLLAHLYLGMLHFGPREVARALHLAQQEYEASRALRSDEVEVLGPLTSALVGYRVDGRRVPYETGLTLGARVTLLGVLRRNVAEGRGLSDLPWL